MTENPRTTTARDNDDSELIEDMIVESGATLSTAGGRLAADVGSANDLTRAISDEDALTRPQKEDDQHADQAYRSDRPNIGDNRG